MSRDVLHEKFQSVTFTSLPIFACWFFTNYFQISKVPIFIFEASNKPVFLHEIWSFLCLHVAHAFLCLPTEPRTWRNASDTFERRPFMSLFPLHRHHPSMRLLRQPFLLLRCHFVALVTIPQELNPFEPHCVVSIGRFLFAVVLQLHLIQNPCRQMGFVLVSTPQLGNH